MRTVLLAALVVCMFALMSVLSVPVVSAEDNEVGPLRCTIDIMIDKTVTPPPPPHWVGTIDGDIVGTIELWPIPDESYNVGPGPNVRHYAENFVITTKAGDVIKGYESGVWTFSTLKFRSHGMVTDATGDFAYLVGYTTHQMGMTTPMGPKIWGEGTEMFAPP